MMVEFIQLVSQRPALGDRSSQYQTFLQNIQTTWSLIFPLLLARMANCNVPIWFRELRSTQRKPISDSAPNNKRESDSTSATRPLRLLIVASTVKVTKFCITVAHGLNTQVRSLSKGTGKSEIK